MANRTLQPVEDEWVSFPGGELEGRRPQAWCPACREAAARGEGDVLQGDVLEVKRGRTLCFQCYRAELDRTRAFGAAGELHTASDARFQDTLPFEPVNKRRLEMLKVERDHARETQRRGGGGYVERRRQAQVNARHALHAIFAGVKARDHSAQASISASSTSSTPSSPWSNRDTAARAARAARAWESRAAELRFPASWLPFVVSR